MAKLDHLVGSKDRILSLLVATGWPKRVGLNDKKRTCHNRVFLDKSTVHTFWTKGHPFFVYDPALELVATGQTRDEALIAMVNARENLRSRDSRAQGEGPTSGPHV